MCSWGYLYDYKVIIVKFVAIFMRTRLNVFLRYEFSLLIHVNENLSFLTIGDTLLMGTLSTHLTVNVKEFYTLFRG